MKTFKQLYHQIYDFANLLQAFRNARKGKKNKRNVAAFEWQLEDNVLQLQQELQNKTYQPGAYRTFKIYDPKERMISAAPFRDRVVHHALCQVVMPIFERSFIHDSYANRKGKGTHVAIRRCQGFLRKNQYVLKADIQKYFPSIDHALLKAAIHRKIACKDTLWLIDSIIDNSNAQEERNIYFPGDDMFTPYERRRGLPLGNLTSQYFANIYLNGFDHFIKDELGCKYYIRYVDDFVIFHTDKNVLWQIKTKVERYLQQLRLKLHPDKCYVAPVEEGVTFLGQRIFATHRLLRKENVRRFRKRQRMNFKKYRKNERTVIQMESGWNAWLGHAAQADTYRLRNRLFNEIARQGLNVAKTDRFAWRLLEQQQ